MKRRLAVVGLAAVLGVLALGTTARAADQQQRFGTSVEGRRLALVTRGAQPIGAAGVLDVLVVGTIHGNERAGEAIVAHLRRASVPAGQRWWLVTTINPDGAVAKSRQNARGVDLNRNFPHRWLGGGAAGDTYYPGRAAGSERETRAVQALVQRVRPELTVWYHQHANLVVRPDKPRVRAVAAAYARTSALPLRAWAPLRGTVIGWQGAFDPSGAPLVVELPAGTLDAVAIRRHARALLAAAKVSASQAS